MPKLEVPKGTRDIEIQLDLAGAEQEDYAAFNALVRSSEASEVWSRQGLEPQPLRRETGPEWGTGLVLEIPANQLPEGKYEVEIQGVNTEGEAEPIGVQEFEIVAD